MKSFPAYYLKVFEAAALIPVGKVSSYGRIAAYCDLGSPRMVGWALKHAFDFVEFSVPAHRVVNTKGVLTGMKSFNPPELMIALLAEEGVSVKNNQVVDVEQYMFDFDV